MGKAAALCSGSTRGLVSLLSAVPCLACHELPGSGRRAMSNEAAATGAGSRGGGGGGGGGSAGTAPAAPGSDTYKGWLFKWTNYLKGYQRRWFVLSNGLLSYYRYRDGVVWELGAALGKPLRALPFSGLLPEGWPRSRLSAFPHGIPGMETGLAAATNPDPKAGPGSGQAAARGAPCWAPHNPPGLRGGPRGPGPARLGSAPSPAAGSVDEVQCSARNPDRI